MSIGLRIKEALHRTIDTLFFFSAVAVKEGFSNRVAKAGAIDMNPEGCIAILGNGPSLKAEMQLLSEREEWTKMDTMAVNFFALSDEFIALRPKYYILSDPQFFRKAGRSERRDLLYDTLSRVDWQMTLYVQCYNPEHFDYAAAVGNNPNIRIVPFHTIPYRGYRCLEHWCYRHGLGSGNFGTVVQNGIFVALLLGYKQIELYGVDHTLLDGLMVNEQNQLCRTISHYYDGAPTEPTPIYVNATNPPQPYTMSSYLAETAELFRGHEVLERYARSRGARILNRTRGSLIDSYERQPLE